MRREERGSLILLLSLLFGSAQLAGQEQRTPPSPQQTFLRLWNVVQGKALEMAEDFPEEKYSYRPHEDARSFAEEIMHVAVGNANAAAAHRGERLGYEEIRARFQAESKADIIAKLKESIQEAAPAIKSEDNLRLLYWLEHAAEHYGKLVTIYRINGLVPPATRRALEMRRQYEERQKQEQQKKQPPPPQQP